MARSIDQYMEPRIQLTGVASPKFCPLDISQELWSYPRLLARCGAFDYRKLTKAYWFWEMRRDDHARAGPPPDGEDLAPAVRVAFGRGPGRRRFSGRGAEAGLAKLPPFLVERLRHVATI